MIKYYEKFILKGLILLRGKASIASVVMLMLLFTSMLVSGDMGEAKIAKGQVLSSQSSDIGLFKIADTAKIEKTVFTENFNSRSTKEWTLKNNFSIEKNSQGVMSASVTNYSNNAQDVIISPSIELAKVKEQNRIILHYTTRYEMESEYDFGRLSISKDNGVTWKQLHSVSGKSDYTHEYVDITSFAGNSIKLKFELTSDNSNEYEGWEISDITINIESDNSFSSIREGSLVKSDSYTISSVSSSLNAVMTNLNAKNFPYIYMNIDVSDATGSLTNLTKSNFTVLENNVTQTKYFDVTPPSGQGSSRLTDIVFIMDNSGSMSEEQNAVKNNVIKFLNDLDASGINYAVGLCRYGQFANSGNPIFEDAGILTTDSTYFKDNVWARNVVSGGHEPGYRSIVESLSDFSFRPGSQKVIIIITDETPNQDNVTETDAQNALVSSSATLYALTERYYFPTFQKLVDVSNGKNFDIYSNFDDILQEISNQVSASYLVKYSASNAILDGVLRHVTVKVNYNSEEANATGSYTPGAAPVIERTQNTKDYELNPHLAGTEFVIEAKITDAVEPFVYSAALYYKTVGDNAYTTSLMYHDTVKDVWSATIPAAVSKEPGVSYYIVATDTQATSSLPSTSPRTNPFNIAVLPNYAPAISNVHEEVTSPGKPIAITCNAVDTTNNLNKVSLFYRQKSDLTYKEIPMNNQSGDVYAAAIPGDDVASYGIEYYILAVDDFSVASTYGTPDNPKSIALGVDITPIIMYLLN